MEQDKFLVRILNRRYLVARKQLHLLRLYQLTICALFLIILALPTLFPTYFFHTLGWSLAAPFLLGFLVAVVGALGIVIFTASRWDSIPEEQAADLHSLQAPQLLTKQLRLALTISVCIGAACFLFVLARQFFSGITTHNAQTTVSALLLIVITLIALVFILVTRGLTKTLKDYFSTRMLLLPTALLFLSVHLSTNTTEASPATSGPTSADIKSLTTRAEEGDVTSQAALGLMYARGLNVPQDYAQAAKWYRQAAEHGYGPSEVVLGGLYFSGQGVTQNYAEALKWYRKAAEQGIPIAQFLVATMYEHGQSVKKDEAESAKWYRLAADRDLVGAQVALGEMYRDGRGVKQDYAEAAQWFKRAAEHGSSTNTSQQAYSHDQHDPTVTSEFLSAEKQFHTVVQEAILEAEDNLGQLSERGQGMPQNLTAAITWYREAATHGYAKAQDHLGINYVKGRGVSQDYEAALKWFRMAAEQGDAVGETMLGSFYLEGQGVPQDYAEAIKWLRKAAEQNSGMGEAALGQVYEHGLGVTQDYGMARKLYLDAAEQGVVSGYNGLGDIYSHGEGVTQDYTKAEQYYRSAAERGFPRAEYNLGKLYSSPGAHERKYEDAYFWLVLASHTGDTSSAAAKDEAAAHLTKKQIEEVEKRAAAWKPRSSADLPQ